MFTDFSDFELHVLKEEARDVVQMAIQRSGETFKPSPGQIMSHVHHRVAVIATDALFDFLGEWRWTPPPLPRSEPPLPKKEPLL